MTTISIDLSAPSVHPAFSRCPRCDRRVRLQGIEPHPRLPDVDLHTYGCDTCGTTEVLIAPMRPIAANGGDA